MKYQDKMKLFLKSALRHIGCFDCLDFAAQEELVYSLR